MIKSILVISLSMLLLNCAPLISNPEVDGNRADVGTPKAERTPKPNANDILSKDYSVAEKALARATVERDLPTVALGLKSPIFTVRIKTADAIFLLDDESFVADLVATLEINQGRISGGSERQYFQQQLNTSLVNALGKITKQDFKVSKPPTPAEIKDVIKKSKSWVERDRDRRNA